MAENMPVSGALPDRPRRIDWLIVVLVTVVLGLVWAIAAIYLTTERTRIIDQTRAQLAATASTLADLDELARQLGPGATAGSEQRTGAIWRALLQYPTANIWIETDGAISAGQRPAGDLLSYLTVEERRTALTVHAALPLDDVLAGWRRTTFWETALLLAITVAVLGLATMLSRTLRQRAIAERDAAAADERARQLARYRAELEETVSRRTNELKDTNTLLEKQLVERKAAEDALREHDALLKAVTRSAAELLGSRSFEEAIPTVLALIGQVLSVSRVQIAAITQGKDGHLVSSFKHEWTTPGAAPALDRPAFKGLDLTEHFQKLVLPLLTGASISFFIDDITPSSRALFEEFAMNSFLEIPVMLDGKIWGTMNFVDAGKLRRQWSWAELDTLETLAGLVGAAVSRTRYIRDLAYANMIVQNSPTVLYRLRGEPSLPLIYISHNITKFGHEPKSLVGEADWAARLIHPDDRAKVVEAITRVLQKISQSASIEFRLVTGTGGYRWIENRFTAVRDEQTRLIEVEGIMIDITERKEAEEKIALLARTDSLTGLANRATFNERLEQAFEATRRGAMPFSVLMIDVDHFKNVNDTLGHPAGDELLKKVAERLKSSIRSTDLAARLGGDEFGVLQTEMNDPTAASALAAKVHDTVSQTYSMEGADLHVTVSIGVSPYLAGTSSPETMMAQADLALYRAKEEGRDRYRFHVKELDDEMHARNVLAEDLRRAVENSEFQLQYQPQIEVTTGNIVGMEALVRWNHPTRGLLAPKEFIAVAEKTGAIVMLGRWVLDQACRQMRAWEDAGIAPPTIAVNLSLAELKAGNALALFISNTLAKYRLEPKRLELDVTEAILAQVTLSQNDVLDALQKLGVNIAIDDFGTQYSSFSYLRDYRVNHVKIARSFLTGAAGDPGRTSTIRAIIGLARDLGINVIAEGVETRDQRNLLLASGSSTTEAQGFYFSEPVDAGRAATLLRQKRIDPTNGGAHTDPSSAAPASEAQP
jgi:diguanylate cyclase (GGDEF)-like protein/PAS domain S-box-containing protein